jgi:hypothetical protein
MIWDGRDRRGLECCDSDLKSDVAALKVWREAHADKLVILTTELTKTNENLARIADALNIIRTEQKITHAFVGMAASLLGFLGEHFWRHVGGG